MSGVDLALVRLLLASIGCTLAGLSVWALGALLRRALPALAAQRSMWLLSQITVAATFVLVLLPQSERVRLLPPIEEATAAVTPYLPTLPPPQLPARGTPSSASSQAEAPGALSWPALGARAWLAIYLLGLGHALYRLWQGQRLVQALARCGQRLAGARPAMIEVDAPIAPMLLGLFKPRLLLPRHLRSFDPLQQELIVAHELTHWRRRDLHWLTLGVVLQTLLWFNPFMRLLRAHLAWAQELGCDRDVLHGRPAAQRKAYAAALVAQLKLQCAPVPTALAFGGFSVNSVAERVAMIRSPGSRRQRLWSRGAMAAGLAAIAAGNFALQPALAWNAEPAQAAHGLVQCTVLMDAATGATLARDGQCGVRVTPVSTFNIAVSLMGFDSGILQDEHAPRLPFKQGYPDWNEAWRQDLDPSSWIKVSSVWYAQQVTTRLGVQRFQRYVDAFRYGNRDVSGDQRLGAGLGYAWIDSTLKISVDEQAAFMRRIVRRELGVSDHAYDMTARILKHDARPGGWEVHGKTGTGYPIIDGKDVPEHAYGWFVGWAVKDQRTVVFAHLIQDRVQQEGSAGQRARDAFLRSLPARLAAAP